MHPHTQGAAEAAECANEQGAYWRYHRILFAHRDSLDRGALLAHARAADLDVARFSKCLGSAEVKAKLRRDAADGRSYGVTGTPTFFINGRPVRGAQPFGQLEAVLDRALAEGK